MITKTLRTEKEIMADWKVEYSIPLLSISCLAYNHEKYIEDTLEGFLIQKTDFPFEIVIHDDASTDNTANIIRKYEALYPNIIKPIYQKENQFSKGFNNSAMYNFPRLRGKYVAICEGDDYWTDSNKLSNAVKFLEEHEDYIGCCHDIKVINENNESVYYFLQDAPKKDLLGVSCQLKYNNISTLSLVFKNIWKENLANIHLELTKNCGFIGDFQLKCLLLTKGKIRYFDRIMGVYRWHRQGGDSFSSQSKIVRSTNGLNATINAFRYFEKELSYKEIVAFKNLISGYYLNLIFNNLLDKNLQQCIYLCRKVFASRIFNRTFFSGYTKVVKKNIKWIYSLFISFFDL